MVAVTIGLKSLCGQAYLLYPLTKLVSVGRLVIRSSSSFIALPALSGVICALSEFCAWCDNYRSAVRLRRYTALIRSVYVAQKPSGNGFYKNINA